MGAQRYQPETELDPDAARIRQRLRALRSRYPGVALLTELTHIHDDQVVLRATLSLPDGTSVSAFAAEPSDSSGLLDGAIELAEQRATARALDLLGVGDVPAQSRRAEVESAPQRRVEPEPTPAPINREEVSPPPVVDALRKAQQRRATPVERDEDEVAPAAEAAEAESAEPEVESTPEPAPERASEPDVAEAAADEPDMADYTWTHFWTWARANQLSTKGQVEQRIGRPIDNLTPRDVRQLLHETGLPL